MRMTLLVMHLIGPFGCLMLVSVIVFIVLGYTVMLTSASYLDKSSTDKAMVFRTPLLKRAVGAGSSIMFVFCGLFSIASPRSEVPLSTGLPLLVLFLSIAVLFFYITRPYTLTLDLTKGSFVRKSDWIPSLKEGSLSEIVGVETKFMSSGPEITYYVCELVWASKKNEVIGQFRKLKDANELAKLVGERLNISVKYETRTSFWRS